MGPFLRRLVLGGRNSGRSEAAIHQMILARRVILDLYGVEWDPLLGAKRAGESALKAARVNNVVSLMQLVRPLSVLAGLVFVVAVRGRAALECHSDKEMHNVQ